MSFLWGNTANQEQNTKKFANISDDQLNSNQQAQPVPYLAGRNYLAGNYISPAYNPEADPIKSQTGKNDSSTTGYKYFADFALMFCMGGRRPVDAIYTVIVDSNIRWFGNVQRGTNDYVPIQVEDGKLGTFYLYWGTETQGIDQVLLSVRPVILDTTLQQDKTQFPPNTPPPGSDVFEGFGSGDPDPYSGHYDSHPAYRGQCYAVFKHWKLGKDRTSIPNIQLELGRACPFVNGTIAPLYDQGVNPIAVLYDWLTDTRFGMALPDSALNIQSFIDTYNTLESYGARISPVVNQQTDFRQAVADLLQYYDGWIRRNGNLLEVGLWKTGNIPAGPTLTDDQLLADPELSPQGWGPTINEVNVTYKDRQHHFNDYVQTYRDPNNFRITGGPRPETYARPYLTDAVLAKQYARTVGAVVSLPFTQGELTVKREWLSNNHILQGAIFTYNSAFYGTSTLMRITDVEYEADHAAEAKLTVEWERSKWPSLYQPPALHGPGGFVIGPRAIWQMRIVEVPYLMADKRFDTQLICLAVRGNVEVMGYRIWVSFDNTTYQLVPNAASTSSFASFGRLTTALGSSKSPATAYFSLFGIGQGEVVSQTVAEQRDDNLMLFIQGEVLSVGGVIALGHGRYKANVTRGRYGTFVTGHTAPLSIFFLHRNQLRLLDNAGFIPGTQIYVKLQPFTADTDLDITSLTPFTYTVVGFGDIPTPVLDPAPGSFVTGFQLAVSNPPAGFITRFTRDGTPVTGKSPEWPKKPDGSYGTTPINSTKTIRVRFYNSDTGRTSVGVQGIYTKVNALPTGPAQQCATPTWSYTGVLGHSAGVLTLIAVTTGSVINWSLAHLGVVTTGTGGGPFSFALGDVMTFYATKADMVDSQIATLDNTPDVTYGGGGHNPPRNGS